MAKFVYRPDPEQVAFESRQFWLQRCTILEEQLTDAHKIYDHAYFAHEGNESNYKLLQSFQEAEARLTAIAGELEASRLKRGWDDGYRWKESNVCGLPWATKIFIHPQQMPQPWRDDPAAWTAIFSKFHPNK